MSLNVEALRSSFELVAPQADLLAERFYDKLFEDYPHLEELFVNTDIEGQRKKLIQSLSVIVKSLENPKTLGKYLHELGDQHDQIGVTEEDYPPVAKTLLAVLAELAGDAWTDELESAWSDALNAIAGLMLEGAQEAKKLVTSSAKASSGVRAGKKSSSSGGTSHLKKRSKKSGAATRKENDMSVDSVKKSKGSRGAAKQTPDLDQFYSMVENVPINVMLANEDLDLVYMNAASTKTLRTLEQYLPSSVEELVGQSIDIFHKDPSFQRNFLSNPSNLPHQALINVGPETLDLQVSAVTDSEGKYIGPMVTWSVVTQKLQLEREAARVQSMVEMMPSNVLMANLDLELTYANPASIKQLRGLEQYLPVKVDELIGQNIDIFHKNPEHQRKLLSDPKNLPHRAIINVGPETLDLLVSAVTDNDGTYIGPMVTWEVVTEKLKLENEAARVQSMVEMMPINVLMANLDFELTYANPASIKQLRGLEQYLPVRVDELLGQNIDIFHKDPAHQRKLLADPKNLPHQATISVGPETLELNVSAVTDKDGTYIGPMVTWEVVTEKLKLENEAARVQSMVEKMPINVLMANMDLEITYANPASIQQLRGLEQYLPVRVDDLLGQNIDIFHKNPSHQRNLLGNANNLPHRAQISVGPEILELNVSAVTDKDGTYIGPMVTWEVVTEKMKLENEMVRVQNMMDNIPINVMMTNRDLELVYINPASYETLKPLQSLLPVPVDQLLGQKIDIFHKNPEHQRQLLANPANLPHGARIELGEHTLDLQVSAIYDKAGEYIGPMVCWRVVTDQVQMADDFETNIKAVVQAVTSSATEMQASSKTLAATSEETARQSQVVAAASEEATKNVETVSSAAEELSASISEISKHVQDASSMTQQAVQEAQKTNITIKDLGESSNEIGQVIKVITSIAQQTNLLALNATIEAARAGEAGKGFAVVANEVKELARQTARATEEISQKIGAIQSSAGASATAIESIGDSISKINDIATTIASAVEEQTASTNEISRNVTEAAKGTAEVTSNITGVSQAADEGGKGANEVLSVADGLAKDAASLDTLTNEFLERMREF